MQVCEFSTKRIFDCCKVVMVIYVYKKSFSQVFIAANKYSSSCSFFILRLLASNLFIESRNLLMVIFVLMPSYFVQLFACYMVTYGYLRPNCLSILNLFIFTFLVHHKCLPAIAKRAIYNYSQISNDITVFLFTLIPDFFVLSQQTPLRIAFMLYFNHSIGFSEFYSHFSNLFLTFINKLNFFYHKNTLFLFLKSPLTFNLVLLQIAIVFI